MYLYNLLPLLFCISSLVHMMHSSILSCSFSETHEMMGREAIKLLYSCIRDYELSGCFENDKGNHSASPFCHNDLAKIVRVVHEYWSAQTGEHILHLCGEK